MIAQKLAGQVSEQVEAFTEILSRREIIQKSLDQYGYILVAETMEEAIETVNEIASEHLELVTQNPFEVMTKIKKRRGHIYRGIQQRTFGRLFRGPQSCAAHQRNGEIFLTPVCG